MSNEQDTIDVKQRIVLAEPSTETVEQPPSISPHTKDRLQSVARVLNNFVTETSLALEVSKDVSQKGDQYLSAESTFLKGMKVLTGKEYYLSLSASMKKTDFFIQKGAGQTTETTRFPHVCVTYVTLTTDNKPIVYLIEKAGSQSYAVSIIKTDGVDIGKLIDRYKMKADHLINPNEIGHMEHISIEGDEVTGRSITNNNVFEELDDERWFTHQRNHSGDDVVALCERIFTPVGIAFAKGIQQGIKE